MIVGYKLIWTGTELKDVPIRGRREMKEVKAPKVKSDQEKVNASVYRENRERHNHKACSHTICQKPLRYCSVCDVVHCEICGKEWVEKINTSTYTYTTC